MLYYLPALNLDLNGLLKAISPELRSTSINVGRNLWICDIHGSGKCQSDWVFLCWENASPLRLTDAKRVFCEQRKLLPILKLAFCDSAEYRLNRPYCYVFTFHPKPSHLACVLLLFSRFQTAILCTLFL